MEYNQEYINKRITRRVTMNNIIFVVVLGIISILSGVLFCYLYRTKLFLSAINFIQSNKGAAIGIACVPFLATAIYLYAQIISIPLYCAGFYVISYIASNSEIAAAMISLAMSLFICRNLFEFFYNYECYLSIGILGILSYLIYLNIIRFTDIWEIKTGNLLISILTFGIPAVILIAIIYVLCKYRRSQCVVSKLCSNHCRKFMIGNDDNHMYSGHIEQIRLGMLILSILLFALAIIPHYKEFGLFFIHTLQKIYPAAIIFCIGYIVIRRKSSSSITRQQSIT